MKQRRSLVSMAVAYLLGLFCLLAYWELKLHDNHMSVKFMDTIMFSNKALTQQQRYYYSLQDETNEKQTQTLENQKGMLSHERITSHTKASPISPYRFDRNAAETYLHHNGPETLRKTIIAYLEPPMNYILKPASQGDPNNDEDPGYPPEYVQPLPLRTTTPADLKVYQYPNFKTCRAGHSIAATFPIDRGREPLQDGTPWNVGDEPLPSNFVWDEARYCPVDADPFLPQIHDMFPSHDGTVIEFIAHNKRRCRTGRNARAHILRLDPQVALFQPVTVQHLTEQQARGLAPLLWYDDTKSSVTDGATPPPRYRLAPVEESDGPYTRFICRFHATDVQANGDEPRSIWVADNLAIFPFNYEFVTYHKRRHSMLTPKGKDTEYYWMAVLRFQCPVPKELQALVQSGNSILSDGTPTLHVDVIPIRTPPRYGTKDMYLSQDMIGPPQEWGLHEKEFWGWRGTNQSHSATVTGFQPQQAWGDKHVLPAVEASGRWTNLPICQPPQVPTNESNPPVRTETHLTTTTTGMVEARAESPSTTKPHFLAACLWASAVYKARGVDTTMNADPSLRLLEWIEFHLMVGFDHIYVYDNSGSQSNETSFASIVRRFPKSQVTHIDWPVTICNHNPKNHDSQFEWSSQYTAENSCRTRAAPFTEWIAHFDIDEYFVPKGKHASLREVLEGPQNNGTNILTFRSSRSLLLYDKSIAQDSLNDVARVQMDNVTFLEAYNCDLAKSPKPNWANRRKKQIYRADYVPYHFVHYSPVTKGLLKTYQDDPQAWTPYEEGYREKTERIVDEVHEAVMFHTKTIAAKDTKDWDKKCKVGKAGCLVGFPWPKGSEDKDHTINEQGYYFNCFKNSKVERYWVPRLRVALKSRMKNV
jgi:hypothetical protein